MLWTLALLGMCGLVVVTWVQDNPDIPLEERMDLFALLVVIVAVVAGTAERQPEPSSNPGRRSGTGWSMLLAGLVGRRKR